MVASNIPGLPSRRGVVLGAAMASLSRLAPAERAAMIQRVRSAVEKRELAQQDGNAAKDSLRAFVAQAWHVIEPSNPLIWNWHLDAICDHVQALLLRNLGGYQNLLINVPPGSMKSTILSVCITPWMWLRQPGWRGIFASGSENVTMRDSMKCRDILNSEWYQQTFKPKWTFAEDQNAKGYYINSEKGFRRATTAGAKITGERADGIFIDDPNDAQQAFSKVHLESVNRWWDNAAANRLTSMEHGVRAIIQQRLNEEDLTGHVLTSEPNQWARLVIRQEFEPPIDKDPDYLPTPLGWSDPRTESGKLMFEARFPVKVIEGERRRLGSYGYAGQHQQRPSPAVGGIFKRHAWRYWQRPGQNLPPVTVRTEDGFREIHPVNLPHMEEQIQSWDMAFKETPHSDFVVGGVWGRNGANRYMLDQVRARMDCSKTIAAVEKLTAAYPLAYAKVVEAKANGDAVVSMLRDRISGLILVEPQGGKIVRANAVAPQVESGNVFLPHPQIAPWVEGFINECASFPNGANDDQVDEMTQALTRMSQQQGGWRSDFIA